MDVDRAAFSAHLPSMLKHISNAHFVAFDLELSGIPTQRQRNTDVKQTVAERYEELKAAAETYHILQVGLTCVEEDAENQKYVLRAFNFNLSPLMYEGVDFERSFTYSSGAVDFLLQHNYQMNAPFVSGIPYLTRSEAEVARQRTRIRWDRRAIPDITIRPENTEALEFVERVRTEIDAWKKLPKSSKADAFSISGQASTPAAESDNVVPLDRFHQRLVHQIVRAEYPEFHTFGRSSSVQVEKKNKRDVEDEKHAQEQLKRRLDRAIFTQVGFRWLAEALAGEHGDLDGLDPGMCSRELPGEEPAENHQAFVRRLFNLRMSLRQRNTILVGHNCFLDLIYIYKNFYGPLPDTVEEFQEALHSLFPMIIDTKYMATSGSGAYAFRSAQLWQIQEAVSNEDKPTIESAGEHPQYQETESYHQAGYDSFITAKVFLKLAARLEAEGKHDAQPVAKAAVMEENNRISTIDEAAAPELSSRSSILAGSKDKKTKKKRNATSINGKSTDKFFSPNMYEQLLTLSEDTEHGVAEKATSSSSALKPQATDTSDEIIALKSATEQGRGHDKPGRSRLIPPWGTDFWRVYGNKLRVYGTKEEVFDLTTEAVVETHHDEEKTMQDSGADTLRPEQADRRQGSFWDLMRSYMQ